MTADPLSDLIAACRALIATLRPAMDLVEQLASGAGHGTHATRPLPLTGSGGTEAAEVPLQARAPLAA